jgi:hypothetical protein
MAANTLSEKAQIVKGAVQQKRLSAQGTFPQKYSKTALSLKL